MAVDLPSGVINVIHKKDFKTPVIGITGGKGGVGKTTVAVNLAVALADMGYRVALADADVDAPDAAILLGISLDNPADVFITIPLIDKSKCTLCGDCVKVCRRNALFLPKGSIPILMGECNGCEACILVCPSDAIERGKRAVGQDIQERNAQSWHFYRRAHPGYRGKIICGECPEGKTLRKSRGF